MNIAIWSKEVTGSTFTVSVTTTGEGVAGGISATLQYDTAKLRLNSRTLQGGWSNVGGDDTTWMLMNTDLPGPGSVATLSFTRIGTWADGETAKISLVNTKISDGTTEVAANNDTATITYKAPVVQQPDPQPETPQQPDPNTPVVNEPENPETPVNCPEGETNCLVDGGQGSDAADTGDTTEQPEATTEQPSRWQEFLDSPWAYAAGGFAAGGVLMALIFTIVLLVKRARVE